MAYNALAVLMLISAPSDLPDEDLATVKRTVSQWNLAMGRTSSVVVLPVSWSEHAVAEFGERPQAILNEQLVDEADMALALFADRLGTPTGSADSGTLEEIERMVEAGKPVCVLVNRAPRPPVAGTEATAEKQRLEAAIEALYQRAIVLTYASQAELVGHLNNMLSRAAGKIEGAVGSMTSSAVSPDAVGVWPSVESTSRPESDSKGRIKNKISRRLVLHNRTGRPVYDVGFSYPEDVGFQVLGRDDVTAIMPPDGKVEFPLIAYMGGDTSALCTVTWHFEGEEPRESLGSIRL